MSEMIRVLRGNWTESRHRGHVAVVDASGALLHYLGDPFRPTFARSAMKPVQALPLVMSGAADRFGFGPADLALSCASHNGEERHRLRAASMLARAGLREDVLECGFHPPRHRESHHEVIRKGVELTPVFSNCSGKHAGMVATAAHLGEDPTGYSAPDHPVQRRILREVSAITGCPEQEIVYGVDGCNVPAYRLPLDRLALIYARLADPASISDRKRRGAAERVTEAMVTHPEMVGGKERFCTDLMEAFRGCLVGKVGAEAVYCIGDRQQGIGIAVKIEDGAERVLYAAAVEVLRQLEIGTQTGELERLSAYTRPEVKNMRGRVVGRIEPDFELRSGEPARW
ncbi:asparaginase [Melghirimyces profundicolus]|uniref:Asparaginase n=1 Tax=Melghirimyces profundicolus TaxID=1242148 RepID=A0A2T6BSV0_9BACL|nr:asparaginase [Melghirimyces profundicolus]PTX59153.1 asparaginase [Melghirimyces profundicolus]